MNYKIKSAYIWEKQICYKKDTLTSPLDKLTRASAEGAVSEEVIGAVD